MWLYIHAWEIVDETLTHDVFRFLTKHRVKPLLNIREDLTFFKTNQQLYYCICCKLHICFDSQLYR